ncbi:MAG TPA: CoA-binding protein [Solimonas sp.]|nr:CoA-binding protein [Solimonas sp.]
MAWQGQLLESDAQIAALLTALRRIAVLGMRGAEHAHRPAYYVPETLQRMGLQIVPVPVHDLKATQMLGQPVYHRLADIPGELDLVDVFRRPMELAPHLPDILAKRPAAVWLQTGIRHDAFAERLVREGIAVVQDRCLMVEYRRHHKAAG